MTPISTPPAFCIQNAVIRYPRTAIRSRFAIPRTSWNVVVGNGAG